MEKNDEIIPQESRDRIERMFNRYMSHALKLDKHRRLGWIEDGQYLEQIERDRDDLLESIIVEVAFHVKGAGDVS